MIGQDIIDNSTYDTNREGVDLPMMAELDVDFGGHLSEEEEDQPNVSRGTLPTDQVASDEVKLPGTSWGAKTRRGLVGQSFDPPAT